MKTTHIATLSAVLLSAVIALPAQASVSAKSVDTIYKGETEAQVLMTLGAPENAPHWLDGSHSLVYKMQGNDGSQTRAYVNVDANGKVINVQSQTDD